MRPMLTAAVTLVLAACPAPEDGDPNLVECTFDEIAVAWSEAAPDGTVPDEVLALVEGAFDTTGGYVDRDEEIDVSASLARRGDNAVFYSATGGGCPDVLAFPVTMTFSTSDDAFDETLEIEATYADGRVEVQADLPESRVDGDFEPEPDASVYGVQLLARFSEGAVAGEVEVLVEGSDGSGDPDGTSWASRETYFVFGER